MYDSFVFGSLNLITVLQLPVGALTSTFKPISSSSTVESEHPRRVVPNLFQRGQHGALDHGLRPAHEAHRVLSWWGEVRPEHLLVHEARTVAPAAVALALRRVDGVPYSEQAFTEGCAEVRGGLIEPRTGSAISYCKL